MKPISFAESIVLALLASALGAAMYSMFSLFDGDATLRLVIDILALAYVTYLLIRSRERTGRIVVWVSWCVAALFIWGLQLSLPLYLFSHMALIWIVRSLYYYSSLVSALVDLGVNIVSMLAAVTAAVHTDSIFISLWCYFLLQSLFVYIPRDWHKRDGGRRVSAAYNSEDFERAHQVAEAAIRRLSSIN